MQAALAELVVLDVSGSVATSFCAKQLADYGARVINIEPDEGFPTRFEPPFLPTLAAPENSALHAWLHTNKRSVKANDLSTAQLSTLLTSAHLVLDDGDIPAPIQAAWKRPPAVRLSISWYGSTGPYRHFQGSDAQVFALNAMLRNIGHEAGPPMIPTGYQTQVVAGMTAYIAALGHILAVELGNHTAAVHLETSILESALCFTDVAAITFHNTGLQPARLGINRFPPTAPMGVYPCRDGWLGVTVLTPSQWHAFCDLLDMQDFRDMPLFQTAIDRFEANDLIEPVMRERLLQHSAEELFYRGQAAAIPLARVPTMEELFAVDQFIERQAFAAAQMTETVQVQVPSVPFRLFATPPHFGGQVARLGEYSEDMPA